MKDLEKVICAVEIFLDIISDDTKADGVDTGEIIKISDIDLKPSEARKKARDYLNILDKQVLIDMETALFVGREIHMGSRYSCDDLADLKAARKKLGVISAEHCDSKIMSMNTRCLIEYFNNFLEVVKLPKNV